MSETTGRLTFVDELLLNHLRELGPTTTPELNDAYKATVRTYGHQHIYNRLVALHGKGLVSRLPDFGDRIPGSRSVLWFALSGEI